MGSTEIVMSSVRLSVRPSVRPSVRLSVTYFSAGIAAYSGIVYRGLKFCTKVRWCVRLNSTVRNFGSVA
jgi:hypothetical protein